MKRLLLVFLVFIMLFSCSYAANSNDYSSLSVEELQDVINAARNALLAQTAQSEDKLFILDEPSGLQIYLTGKCEKSSWGDIYELEVVVINNSKNDVSINFDNIAINGWETHAFSMIQDVGAGKKKKDIIDLRIEDADIDSISSVEEIEFAFHTFDSSTFNTIKEYKNITIYYDGSVWSK